MASGANTPVVDMPSSSREEGAQRAAVPPPLPELLAPAGDWECAKAAVENGADAIYFGLERFNARMRAQNFTEADLPSLLEYLHRRGVKGYITFNTLVFENEMAEAEQYVRTMVAAGVDAAIVQDVGICRLIRRLSPDFPIHVSTQMTVTSLAGVEFARELGCNLVVLARECSLKEIEKIQAAMKADPQGRAPVPLEVFVHGALCVAYSGQCLTSEALGGRSANRGECAQACRMPYELMADGEVVPLGDRKYLLSPQDLAGLPLLPELARVGVASLKIEGRLKSPEYVANITRVYRQALDAFAPETARQTRTRGAAPIRRSVQYDMEMAFSRGLYTGWLQGTNNQNLVHGRFGKKRGVYLGKVSEVCPNGVLVRLEAPLKPGDGVVFDAGRPEEKEEGGRVYEILATSVSTPHRCRREEAERAGAQTTAGLLTSASTVASGPVVLLTFGRGDIELKRIHPGDKIWKTSDPELERELRQTFQSPGPKYQRPIRIEVHGRAGTPLTLIVRDELGHIVRLDSRMPLAVAEKQPLGTERLREHLGRLGGTVFVLDCLDNFLAGPVLVPVSELNRLRRDLVRELEMCRAQPPRWTLREDSNLEALSGQPEPAPGCASPELIVLARNLPQLEAALQMQVGRVYCDFEDPKKYREAVPIGRAAGSEVFVAPPRVFKMGEEWTLKQVRSSEADGYLVRNYDHLQFFAGDRKVGDYSLNIANRLAAEYFKTRFALERLTASYDLNFSQLEALLRHAPPEWFEITLHQHMPMFHMEHCIFCAFLSSGTDYTNCGRPCDRHQVHLRDRVGAEHPVKADAGCRNTVYNALAQTGAEYVARMLALGARHFRLEFLNETPAQLTCTVSMYRQLLAGEISGQDLWRELKLHNQLGVTRGQMAG